VDVIGGLTSAGIINAMAGGADLRVVADKNHTSVTECDGSGIVVRKSLLDDLTANGPAALRGLRIQTSRAGFLRYLTEKLLAMGNLTADDVEIVEPPPPTWPEALSQGTIPVHFASEPWITRMLDSGDGELWMSYRDWAPGEQYAVIVYGPTLVTENREAGKRFMVAFLKAVRQYNEGKTERNLDILTDTLGLERELLERACWPPIYGDGRINLESLLNFQDWAVERGFVETPVTADQLFDPTFIDYANEVLGPAE